LDRPGFQLMLISRSFPVTNPHWNKQFILLYTLAHSKNIPIILVTSNRQEASSYLIVNELGSYIPIFGCDATAVKTAARADPTLYLLKKGTILNKWSYANLEMAVPAIAELPLQEKQSEIKP
jgi:hypothetical protein